MKTKKNGRNVPVPPGAVKVPTAELQELAQLHNQSVAARAKAGEMASKAVKERSQIISLYNLHEQSKKVLSEECNKVLLNYGIDINDTSGNKWELQIDTGMVVRKSA